MLPRRVATKMSSPSRHCRTHWSLSSSASPIAISPEPLTLEKALSLTRLAIPLTVWNTIDGSSSAAPPSSPPSPGENEDTGITAVIFSPCFIAGMSWMMGRPCATRAPGSGMSYALREYAEPDSEKKRMVSWSRHAMILSIFSSFFPPATPLPPRCWLEKESTGMRLMKPFSLITRMMSRFSVISSMSMAPDSPPTISVLRGRPYLPRNTMASSSTTPSTRPLSASSPWRSVISARSSLASLSSLPASREVRRRRAMESTPSAWISESPKSRCSTFMAAAPSLEARMAVTTPSICPMASSSPSTKWLRDSALFRLNLALRSMTSQRKSRNCCSSCSRESLWGWLPTSTVWLEFHLICILVFL
mmetsp:Transcript_71406/g.225500  ORF Transcript_71406/g.225500 Transcript_71406/m.225500 type:complete len:362 (-) Transcript_71406:1369-2454(-)